jgi:hypothetical protein
MYEPVMYGGSLSSLLFRLSCSAPQVHPKRQKGKASGSFFVFRFEYVGRFFFTLEQSFSFFLNGAGGGKKKNPKRNGLPRRKALPKWRSS